MQPRHMINLWGTSATTPDEFGIGVQTATAYFRSNSNFCWHKGGTHSVLNKVLSMPITSWTYKTDIKTRHIGPRRRTFTSRLDWAAATNRLPPWAQTASRWRRFTGCIKS